MREGLAPMSMGIYTTACCCSGRGSALAFDLDLRRPPKSMSDYGHTEPKRGAECWGKSVLLTFDWAGIPAFQK